ncbi:MAG: hypothetical protein ACLSHC_13160 [Bilophila wadsworthia]
MTGELYPDTRIRAYELAEMTIGNGTHIGSRHEQELLHENLKTGCRTRNSRRFRKLLMAQEMNGSSSPPSCTTTRGHARRDRSAWSVPSFHPFRPSTNSSRHRHAFDLGFII